MAEFPNAVLLDVGSDPVRIHAVSQFMTEADRAIKLRASRLRSECVKVVEAARPLLPAIAAARSFYPTCSTEPGKGSAGTSSL